MSEEKRSRAMMDPTELWRQWYEMGTKMDPTELWRQWYETSTKMWSDVFGAGRENYMDPYGLYRQWFNGLEDLQERMFEPLRRSSVAVRDGSPASMVSPAAAENPAAAAQPVADAAVGQAAEVQNLWKQWFEAATDSWQKAWGLGTEAIDLAPRWMAMMDQARHNFLSAEGYPTDPLQLATRWYNAMSVPLSDFVGDLLEHEDTLDVSSRFLQSYASFYKVFRHNSEEFLKSLQIPVRSDITRVAGFVVALEEKIDRLEEAFEDFEYGYAKPATAESLEANSERIQRVERILERIEEAAATAESLEAVEEQISNLESTLERIDQGAAGTASADSVSGLATRLDDVEGKIDRLLAALENAPQNGGAQVEASQEEASVPQTDGEIRATAAARRKAQELGIDLAEVEGTGTNGQVTVDDVRRKNVREEGGS